MGNVYPKWGMVPRQTPPTQIDITMLRRTQALPFAVLQLRLDNNKIKAGFWIWILSLSSDYVSKTTGVAVLKIFSQPRSHPNKATLTSQRPTLPLFPPAAFSDLPHPSPYILLYHSQIILLSHHTPLLDIYAHTHHPLPSPPHRPLLASNYVLLF